mgnify:CR=1 FL=1
MFQGPFLGGGLVLPKFEAADWLVLSIAVLLMLVVSVLQERDISVRALIAKLPLPIRWVIYFAALFSVIYLWNLWRWVSRWNLSFTVSFKGGWK